MTERQDSPVQGPAPPPILRAWDEAETRGPLDAIEADMVRLLRELSDARLSMEAVKRSGREAHKRTLLGILDVLDAMERIGKQMDARQSEGLVIERPMKAWLGSFRTCAKLLRRVLTECRVVESEVGQTFDPHRHHVLETRDDAHLPDGAIIETTSPGYRWDDDLLRKAEVVVARSDADGERADPIPSTG